MKNEAKKFYMDVLEILWLVDDRIRISPLEKLDNWLYFIFEYSFYFVASCFGNCLNVNNLKTCLLDHMEIDF